MDTNNHNINAPGCEATPLPTLRDLERVIERGKRNFLEVLDALHEIHSRKLYLKTHTSFEDYVTRRWHFSRQHAYRLLDARKVIAMSPVGDIPKSEGAARARKAKNSSPRKPAKAKVSKISETLGTPTPTPTPTTNPTTTPTTTIDLKAETEKFHANREAEMGEFQMKMAYWQKFLSFPDCLHLLKTIAKMVDDKLDELEEIKEKAEKARQLATATA